MINLSTTAKQLLSELAEDLKRIEYWNRRWHSGKEWENLGMEYRRKWYETKKPVLGECHEYKSKNGNRWYCFDVVHLPEGCGQLMTCMTSFVYWETYASIGCFLPTYSWNKEKKEMEESCIIYTSHFFERYCERLGIPFRSRQMITEFASAIAFRPFQDDVDKDGNPIKVFRIPKAGIAYGVEWKSDPHIIEVRTFLSDKNMTPNKLRKYEELAERVDKDGFVGESFDTAMISSLAYNKSALL